MIRLYDIPDNTFESDESSDEEEDDDEDEDEEGDDEEEDEEEDEETEKPKGMLHYLWSFACLDQNEY